MNLTIVGTGYVGLVTGVCFANKGHNVICVDNVPEKVTMMSEGKPPIYEEGLEELMHSAINAGNISFTTDMRKGVEHGDIIFFCLPTPQGADGQADLRAVLAVSSQIGEYFNNHKIIVNKSTVPVGTAELVKEKLSQNATYSFDVASNPEFLREGCAVEDFMNPDRVVFGTHSEHARQKLFDLYCDFVPRERIVACDIASSELIKYAANSFLATKISFINEMSRLSDAFDADIDAVAQGMGLDPRIGKRFLQAGIGYGGSCFPKDVAALAYQADKVGIDATLVKHTITANANQCKYFIGKIESYFSNLNIDPKGKRFTILGLAFKPGTDDVREAPAAHIIQSINNWGGSALAYDPVASENFMKFYPDLVLTNAQSIQQALSEADFVIIATDWDEFKTRTTIGLIDKAQVKAVFDGRNIYKAHDLLDIGFDYISVGRVDLLVQPAMDNVPETALKGTV